jgi:anti-sigma28 factor (negative regulator of flagellin synthesis)
MKITSGQRSTGVIHNKSNTSALPARNATNLDTDRVELSGGKEEIKKLTTMMQQIPDNSINKIPQISQQLDAGIYHAEARDVAEKILDRWKDFTGL